MEKIRSSHSHTNKNEPLTANGTTSTSSAEPCSLVQIAKALPRSSLVKRWWLYGLLYLVVLIIGLLMITVRQQLQQVATHHLKAGTELNRADLRPQGPSFLASFQQDSDQMVGKYLKTDVDANNPIWSENLTATPFVTTEDFVVKVKLGRNAVAAKFLQPNSKVVLTSENSAEKHEGVVITTTGNVASGGVNSGTNAAKPDRRSPNP